jgi:hypothetical protein
VLTPTSQMRARRELEPPSDDEGWTVLEQASFARAPRSSAGGAGVFVAAAALDTPGWKDALSDPSAPHLLFDWRPGGDLGALAPAVAGLAAEVSGPVEAALCTHPGGPPSCWCARRCQDCHWRSRARTASSRRAPSSSASAPPTARWRRRSAPGS